jgi:hypothetical protein
MLGRISNSNLANLVLLGHNAKMMSDWWKQYFQFQQKECSLALRPKYELKDFGGKMSIQEYRKGFCSFIDVRPVVGEIQSLLPIMSTKDLIYHPLMKPLVMATMPSVDKPSLTSVDDPTEVCQSPFVTLDVLEDTKHNMDMDIVTEHPTLQTVQDVIHDVVSVHTLQAVSNQLSAMQLSDRPKPPNPPNPPTTPRRPISTSNVTSPTSQPVRKRLKVSKPSPRKSPPKSVHPMFRMK